jgi:hypothetical protein
VVRTQAEAFSQEQADIDRRLMIVTSSDTSNEAVQRFETGMEKLRKLDICKGYMEILKEVDRLRFVCQLAPRAPQLILP